MLSDFLWTVFLTTVFIRFGFLSLLFDGVCCPFDFRSLSYEFVHTTKAFFDFLYILDVRVVAW